MSVSNPETADCVARELQELDDGAVERRPESAAECRVDKAQQHAGHAPRRSIPTRSISRCAAGEGVDGFIEGRMSDRYPGRHRATSCALYMSNSLAELTQAYALYSLLRAESAGFPQRLVLS
jgi:hypothetical protein